MPKVFFYEAVYPINDWRKYHCYYKFINVITSAGYQYLMQAPRNALSGLDAFADVESNEQNHEAVNELRYDRWPGWS